MTFRIKLLSAAALLALPAVAGAQTPTPAQQPGTTMDNVNQTVQNAQDANAANPPAGEQVADEQPRQADQTPPQPAQQPSETQDDSPPAPTGTQTQPPAGTQSAAQPPAEAQPPAQTQAPPAQTQAPPTQAQPPAQTQPTAQPSAQTQAQPAASAQAGATRAATAADVTAGAQVRDTAGAAVGTVETVDADSAIVSTGSVRADIPIASFGHNGQGLVLAMTRAQLEAAARAASTPTG